MLKTGLVFAVALASLALDQPSPLALARQFYNDQQYDKAIVAASEARRAPAAADAAAVVLARAHLERFRQAATSNPADLAAARDALRQVDPSKLSPRDEAEFVIGLGESVFFDDEFSAAAEFFEAALAKTDSLDPAGHDRLFEWWAGALDRQAQLGPEAERKPLYARIVERAEAELRRDDKSASACYWLVAGARGTDDLERAWGAALACWVRAPYSGRRGVLLRGDLDQIVTQVIIPELARLLSEAGDPRPAMAILQARWEETKQKWGG